MFASDGTLEKMEADHTINIALTGLDIQALAQRVNRVNAAATELQGALSEFLELVEASLKVTQTTTDIAAR